ncbi:hypothetical protein [Streptomyces sp. ALI-76-A]|jgi:hypothetical protein|uniref:hypothetical protein n=1 Tax=Streptomyces sp. ALI-76-A TaxID=3025736 RepID=UPI00256F48D0|nr:hypothetical protein [Streptomyces sp. ALI-76-A]MDL5204409.1 hypothetical protein [Streptomyces sp. ALI-76-A]
MFRGTTAWAALAILTAALLALPFFAPTAAFATAHTPRQAEAKAQPGIKLPGKALRDETATQRHCAPAGDPTGPLRTRDRQRTVEVALAGPERPTQAQDPSAAPHPVPGGTPRLSRPPTAHSPAALQVFRC